MPEPGMTADGLGFASLPSLSDNNTAHLAYLQISGTNTYQKLI